MCSGQRGQDFVDTRERVDESGASELDENGDPIRHRPVDQS